MTKIKFVCVPVCYSHMYEPRKLDSRTDGNLNSASHVFFLFTLGFPEFRHTGPDLMLVAVAE
jgi:hypothetical protein